MNEEKEEEDDGKWEDRNWIISEAKINGSIHEVAGESSLLLKSDSLSEQWR